jgi:hypothetical protein
MFGLSHLFYPWGLILQGIAIIHFFRRRPEGYWFYIIFFGSFLGAGVYIIAEVLPDLGLLRGVFQGLGRRSRIQIVETQILDNPSAANYEELGELYKDQKQFAKAREAFTNAITARRLRSDWAISLQRFQTWSASSQAIASSITTGLQGFWQMLTRRRDNWNAPSSSI